MSESYTMLDINEIEFDTDNPRIKKALEKYGDRLNAEKIHFALTTAGTAETGASSYASLRDSIRAARGITIPITVVTRNGGYTCIDGNTRLAVYKDFASKGEDGDWATIKTIVRSNARPEDIERIRVSAHLVGAREWPAYEKARYLHYLRNQKFMDYGQMIQLCGGNRTAIERQIEAYHDMNRFYRDMVDDQAFQIDRFSGFVELQKRGVKEAIWKAGFDLSDFGEWIRDGKIWRLRDVRQLPKVLADPDASQIFLDGGPRSVEDAVNLLRHRARTTASEADTTLTSASLFQLAEALARKVDEMPYSEVRALKTRERSELDEGIATLEHLSTRLNELLDDVGE